ncbi:MAG: BrnA antitoxin family protein [Xanthobacteraceae bacterium]
MKKTASKPFSRRQLAELRSLADLPESAIDTSDAPELANWSGAKRGLFYRPVKQQLTLRLDTDVVAWFKKHTTPGQGYQTRINRALREYVQGHAGKGRRARQNS